MRTHFSKSHHLHGIRVVLCAFSLVALCLARVDLQLATPVTPTQGAVLAYAVNTSRADLLASTNAVRAQNGLNGFSMNEHLNTSAQSKANDMIARNYWSHNTPDGTQPWWFFEQAGYAYTRAGENLAYGFADSSSTITAWMNSPAHRDNVLGSFSEVGFGIASGASYQGGENTVVVAHYGVPAAPPPAPVTTPAVQSATPPTPTPPATETPAQPSAPVAETPQTPKKTAQTPKKSESPKQPVAVAATTQSVPLWQVLFAGKIPLAVSVSFLLLLVVAIGYGLTHRALMRHAILAGENYALHHPIVDVSILAIVTLLVLLTSAGQIG